MSDPQISRRYKWMPFRLPFGSGLALAGILLTACGVSTATNSKSTTAHVTSTSTPSLPPTSVTVLRFGGLSSQNHVAPFQRTVQDAASVQRLYNAVYALPSPPTNVTCPQDRVIGYQLSFMRGNMLVLQVLLSGGCPVAALSNPPDCRRWTHALDTQLAATLEVPESTLVPLSNLFNTAGPTGPFAPYGPTPPVLTNFHCGDQFPTG